MVVGGLSTVKLLWCNGSLCNDPNPLPSGGEGAEAHSDVLEKLQYKIVVFDDKHCS
jgi:hypothetical protein